MGSTVAPKMFSQPGVFGASNPNVINRQNPMMGLEATGAAASTQPSTVATLEQAQSPATTVPAPVAMPDMTPEPPLLPIRPLGTRSRLTGPGAAFYGE